MRPVGTGSAHEKGGTGSGGAAEAAVPTDVNVGRQKQVADTARWPGHAGTAFAVAARGARSDLDAGLRSLSQQAI